MGNAEEGEEVGEGEEEEAGMLPSSRMQEIRELAGGRGLLEIGVVTTSC